MQERIPIEVVISQKYCANTDIMQIILRFIYLGRLQLEELKENLIDVYKAARYVSNYDLRWSTYSFTVSLSACSLFEKSVAQFEHSQ